MKERPILFSAPMVLALLDGRKTQTRRALRDQNPIDLGAYKHGAHLSRRPVHDHGKLVGHRMATVNCPYGQPGDRLWVRETWGYIDPDSCGEDHTKQPAGDSAFIMASPTLLAYWQRRVTFRSTWKEPAYGCGPLAPDRWRPAIHMPRWASRLTLELTGVRVERLRLISEADAEAEGVAGVDWGHGMDYGGKACYGKSYAQLWDQINGAGAWEKNPFVWALTFKRVPQ